MNTEKITFELNRSELQALVALLNSFIPSPDKRIDMMAFFITAKTFKRIMRKLMDPPAPGKNTKLKLHTAEAVALGVMLNNAKASLAWHDYNQNLILKIQNIINQKLA
jgi:hypothetical protein